MKYVFRCFTRCIYYLKLNYNKKLNKIGVLRKLFFYFAVKIQYLLRECEFKMGIYHKNLLDVLSSSLNNKKHLHREFLYNTG